MRRAVGALLVATALLSGCESEQGWSFSNGVGLPEAPPPRIVAEVFEATECGFACRPEGERRYCHELIAGAPGPAPEGLEEGRRYCFLGTAIDESGEAFAIGCAVVEAGGEDIEITLSAFDEARVIARECDTPSPQDAGPRIDAGPMDAGTQDGGPVDGGPVDAGLGFDAGTRTPSELANGTAIEVFVQGEGEGDVFVTTAAGTPLGPQPVRDFVLAIETVVGNPLILRAEADAGRRFVGWNGSDCGTQNPCTFVMDRNEAIRAVFE
ncbi:MAG: hypothetical protein AB8I08_00150 [Sandaracinaceae bacterium]